MCMCVFFFLKHSALKTVQGWLEFEGHCDDMRAIVLMLSLTN